MNNNKHIINWPESVKLARGKKEAAHELLNMFIKTLPKYKKNIRKSFNNDDYETLYTNVHNLNGAVCYCSVPLLKETSYQLEAAIKQKDKEKIMKLIGKIELQIDKIIHVYKNKTYL